MILNCHPDAVGVTIVLMPAIKEVAIFLDPSKRIVSKPKSHHHLFVQTFEIILVKFLHPSCSIHLSVYLQHLWVCVVIMNSAVGLRRAKPDVYLDVILCNTTFLAGFLCSSHYVGIKFHCSHFKLRWFERPWATSTSETWKIWGAVPSWVHSAVDSMQFNSLQETTQDIREVSIYHDKRVPSLPKRVKGEKIWTPSNVGLGLVNLVQLRYNPGPTDWQN